MNIGGLVDKVLGDPRAAAKQGSVAVRGLAADWDLFDQARAGRRLLSRPLWILTGIVVVGAVLRLILIADKSLWLDEAFSFYLSQRSLGDVVRLVAETDIHPFLYYALLKLWLLVGESAAHIRLLSAVFSIASIPLMFLVVAAVFEDVPAGLIGAAILALSPFHIWYAQETRMYAMLVFFVLASAAFFLRALRDGSTKAWAGYVVTTALALYTDYAAIWYVVGVSAFYLLSWKRFPGRTRAWLLSQAAIVLLYAPWLPFFLQQVGRQSSGFWLLPPTFQTILEVMLDFNSLNFPWIALSVLYMTIIFVWSYIVPEQGWQRRLATSWLFVPLILSLLLSLRQPVFLARNLIAASIGYYLLVAGTIRKFHSQRATAVLLLPLLAMNIVSIGRNTWIEKKENWRGLAAHVAALAENTKGGLVVLMPAYTELPFAYYFRQYDLNIDTQGYPQDELLLHPDPQPAGDLSKMLEGRPYVWLVLRGGDLSDADWRVKDWLDRHGYVRRGDYVQDGISVLGYTRWDILADRPPSRPVVSAKPLMYLPVLSRGLAPGEVAPRVHLVQPGDTLFSIARLYNTTVDALAEVNGITNPNRLSVGQRLIVP